MTLPGQSLFALLLLGAAANCRAAPLDAGAAQFYEKSVKPILTAHCLKCHGGEGGKVKGELKLTSRSALLHGGESGPAISLDRPAQSLLLKAISYEDDKLQMPPKQKLGAAELATLKRWVEMGVPYSGTEVEAPAIVHKKPANQVTPESMKFWSFVKVERPAAPAVKNAAWVKNPIDAFVMSKLEAVGFSPAKPASKEVLVRRAYYDLIGLPPKPEEVHAFLNDSSPDAFEKVIDRLLASPHYGEKWGRHWLDLVRFAETNSFERDGVKPNAWRYRDYVIESFNKNKPYDQFIREQIAGDELDQVTPESLIATGYYRLGQWDDEPSDKLQARSDDLDDILTTTSQVFLGLTINCARCHDHKIDPIPQKDYYRFVAFFQNITPYQTSGPNIMTEIAPSDEVKAAEQERLAVEARKEDLRKLIAHFETPVIAKLTDAEKEAIERPRRRAEILRPKILANTNADELRHYDQYREQLKELEDRKSKLPQALVVKETSPRPAKTHILVRGNAASPGEEVTPGFPIVLSPPEPAIAPTAKTTGRRKALAAWLTSQSNPLVSRVMANRLWHYHFGRGIVRSPNDFGTAGEKPTHPELLNWLAAELVSRGWKLKEMHKLIMTSSAYQMSSEADAAALAKDPLNDAIWRYDMRRLTAEEMRDAILAVNGKLNLKIGGPGVYPKIPQTILAGQSVPGAGWNTSTPQDQARRSVYIHVKRSLVVPVISAFDGPDTDFSCPSRFTTTQSTQALMMLNSEFINDEAKAFAKRLKTEAGADSTKQVELALSLAASRKPTTEEVDRGVRFINTLRTKHSASPDVALEQFALLVLNLNEFVYLD